MTTTLTGSRLRGVTAGVYAPQQDSRLLIDTLQETASVAGRRVLDLCTGSGVVAIAAAELGAADVVAYDISPRAVQCAWANADAAGVDVDVRLGSIGNALRHGPYDVVVCNPPYVPAPAGGLGEIVDPKTGTAVAWDAGEDGRRFLDPLCAAAPGLLSRGGTMLIVQSEFADAQQTVASLQRCGLSSEVIASLEIPFGPVLSARAAWLEETGRLAPGRRHERLLVVRARSANATPSLLRLTTGQRPWGLRVRRPAAPVPRSGCATFVG